jgi:hypothetical protein
VQISTGDGKKTMPVLAENMTDEQKKAVAKQSGMDTGDDKDDDDTNASVSGGRAQRNRRIRYDAFKDLAAAAVLEPGRKKGSKKLAKEVAAMLSDSDDDTNRPIVRFKYKWSKRNDPPKIDRVKKACSRRCCCSSNC